MTSEWDALAYHRISEPQFAWGVRVLERIPLTGTERVLDAGCGSGRLTLELARRVPNGYVVAADLSENMIRKAATVLRDALRSGTVRQCETTCADLVALPFRDAFDVVFSTATFHWIHDHDALFSSIREALRAGGRLEAQCGGDRNLERVHDHAKRLSNGTAFRRHFDGWVDPWEFPTASATEERLRRAGFRTIRCWMEPAPTTFASAGEYREFIEKVVMRPFLERLGTADLRSRFLDAMVAAAAADDPAWTLDYRRLNISAALE